MEETISLQDLFKTLKKRLALIIVMTILAITISGVVSFLLLTPIYQSSTQILVNQEKTDATNFNSQEIQANLQLINTYNVIIKSPAILSLVIEELDLDTTTTALTEQITVNNAENSQVVNITVQDPDPKRAVDIANKTAEVFQTEIKNLMKVDNVSAEPNAEYGNRCCYRFNAWSRHCLPIRIFRYDCEKRAGRRRRIRLTGHWTDQCDF